MRNRKSMGNGGGATSADPDTRGAAIDPEALGLDVLAAWVSAAADGVVVLDSELRIVYATPAFCEHAGRPLDQLLGLDALTLVPARFRQTVRTHCADVGNGRSESMLGVTVRADGSELETEVKGAVLDHRGKRYFVFAIRDVTEPHEQARQAAALAQAAASVAGSDSIEAVLDAISECALVGTHALAAWVKVDAEDHVERLVGVAGVPRSSASTCGQRTRRPSAA